MKKLLSKIALVLLVVVCSASALMFSGCEWNDKTVYKPELKCNSWSYEVGQKFEEAKVDGFEGKYYIIEWDENSGRYGDEKYTESKVESFSDAYKTGRLYAFRGFDTGTVTAAGETRTMIVMWYGEKFEVKYTVVPKTNTGNAGGGGAGGGTGPSQSIIQ